MSAIQKSVIPLITCIRSITDFYIFLNEFVICDQQLKLKYLVFLLRRLFAHDLIRHGLILLSALHHRHFLMVLPEIQKSRPCKDNNASRDHLGDRKPDPRDQELVCAESLDPDSPEPVAEDIHEKQLALVFLMLPVKDKDDEQRTAPK